MDFQVLQIKSYYGKSLFISFNVIFKKDNKITKKFLKCMFVCTKEHAFVCPCEEATLGSFMRNDPFGFSVIWLGWLASKSGDPLFLLPRAGILGMGLHSRLFTWTPASRHRSSWSHHTQLVHTELFLYLPFLYQALKIVVQQNSRGRQSVLWPHPSLWPFMAS